jgi:hypothetical protein
MAGPRLLVESARFLLVQRIDTKLELPTVLESNLDVEGMNLRSSLDDFD